MAAALNRSRANLSAFQQLVRDRNLVIAGALLRLQIDTALRFYAAFLVDEPHTFALEVLRGERIDRAKDSEGKHLRDGYLVSKLSAEYPWISRVYNRTSSYIHLSATHIHHAFDIPEDAASFTLKISDVDRELPEELYAEAILAFGEATKILLKYIDGWIYTKANPEHVRRLKEEAKDA